MANKKVSQLTSKPSVLTTDIVPIADPSTGQLFKTTLSALGAVIGSAVASVNGLVGVVVLDTDDIQELASPTNRWFTDTRARAALSGGTGISYNSGTGVITNAVTSGLITTALGYTPADDSLVVKLAGTQTITGTKTFQQAPLVDIGVGFKDGNGLYNTIQSLTIGWQMPVNNRNHNLLFSTSTNYDYTFPNASGTIALTVNSGSLTASSFVKSGGTSSQFLMADGSVSTGVSFTYPGAGIAVSTGSAWGTSIADNSANWNTAYSRRIETLTTSGSSGSATLSLQTLNIPTYTLAGLGGQPLSTNLTSLAGLSYASTSFVKMTASGTFALDTNTYYLASNPSGFITSASLGSYLPLSGGTLTGALSGTTASFTGQVVSTGSKSQFVANGGNSAGAGISLNTSLTSNPSLRRNWGLFTEDQVEGDFAIKYSTAAGLDANLGSVALRILSTGAATFFNTLRVNTPNRSFFITSNAYSISDGTLSSGFGMDGDGLYLGNVTSSSGWTISNPQVTIRSSGNVGIGTTNPDFGSFGASEKILGISNASARARVQFQNTSTGTTGVAGTMAFFNGSTQLGSIDVIADGATNRGRYVFLTNDGSSNSERMRITSGGNLLIGTTSLTSASISTTNTLQVNREIMAVGSMAGLFFENRSGGVVANANWYGWYATGSTVFLYNGSTNIASFSNGGNFSVNGTSTATSFFESSDKTIKTLIEDNYQTKGIESVTAKLYLKNGVEELGYFAQDVQPILPSAVSKGSDGLLNLSYREVHTAKIARLEKRVEELEAQLNSL